MRIGIDIGGTHTDAVLVDAHDHIIAACKEVTTVPVEVAVCAAVQKLLAFCHPNAVTAIMIGSTHATNALLERKELLKVGLIRVAGHKPDLLPARAWPQDLAEMVLCGFETISGGHECDGSEITPCDEKEVISVIQRLEAQGAEALAITSVFSPVNKHHEQLVQQCALQHTVLSVTISSDIGGIGFIERENATILNASLQKVVQQGFGSLQGALHALGIHAPLFMVHNDGTCMDLERGRKFPIFTLSSGQTNSFRGGARLAGVDGALVMDIGGTSSDIGIVENGYPKCSSRAVTIGGVRLNFSLPDVVSLAIGGGTVVNGDAIGPASVAKNLLTHSQAFGGTITTLTDAALLTGHLVIEGTDTHNISLSVDAAHAIMKKVHTELEKGVTLARGRQKEVPVIVVGGASSFFPQASCPDFASVANAYGAALAEISATIDVVVSLHNRDAVIDELELQAKERAIANGASSDTVRIIRREIIPYAYSQDGLSRVIISAAG